MRGLDGRVVSGAAALLPLVGLVACGARPSPSGDDVATGSPEELYSAAAATCAALPVRTTGTTYYLCDCAAPAQAGCVAGSDATDATLCGRQGRGRCAASPLQSWAQAVRAFNGMDAGDSVALCRGGAWVTRGTSAFANGRCRASADMKAAANTTTCDLRDYAPPWGGTAKPIVSSTGGDLIQFASGRQEGVRILNLELRGNGTGPGGTSAGQRAIATQGENTDFLVCNNTIDGWAFGFHLMIDVSPAASRFTVWGNRIVNSVNDGWLGGAANSTIDSNVWDDNGTATVGTHVVYLQGQGVTNTSFVNNDIRHSSTTCNGTQVVVHDQYDGLRIENNAVDGGAASTGTCWGIAVDNGGYPTAGWYRNLTIRRNRITRAGYTSVFASEAPGALIENNLIVVSRSALAIHVPGGAARTSLGEPITTGVVIRNNTVYFTAAATNATGIAMGTEGADHVVANNAIAFAGAGGTCLDLGLPASAYAFVDHNLCDGFERWEATRGSLAAWRTYGGGRFDAASLATSARFAGAPDDLRPAPDSPLIAGGDPAWAPAVDFTLATRSSDRPSIGAYER